MAVMCSFPPPFHSLWRCVPKFILQWLWSNTDAKMFRFEARPLYTTGIIFFTNLKLTWRLVRLKLRAWGSWHAFLTRVRHLAPTPPAQSDRRSSRQHQAHSDWGSGQTQPWPSTKTTATYCMPQCLACVLLTTVILKKKGSTKLSNFMSR